MESSSEKNCKSAKIWQNYGHELVAPFFGPPRMYKAPFVFSLDISTLACS